eukprot:CAMPEP_0202968382 /NCGR_PEP_ID=MMETSP1396-20130829/13649_1 /ASSEMBLY_ACC=CAM_ASM_000872 /TAXON_ID= /ORGANISM="Pseudokeronopsis sp., Strain Brazil" /LENGTH=383 /DNA_ID=CAMNT_0049694623 /DNA_START=40 /DNA_END=1191 /DNA_ORIENTATION=+
MRKSGPVFQRLAYDLLPAPATANVAGGHTKHKVETMVLLHGILGNKKNLRTLAKEFQKFRPYVQAVILDHRGHGESIPIALQSGHASGPQTVASCAKDLLETFSSADFLRDVFSGIDPHHEAHLRGQMTNPCHRFVPEYVCAHSFGGKVALQYYKELLQDREQLLRDHRHPSHSHTGHRQLCSPLKDVWILDSSPFVYPAEMLKAVDQSQSVAHVLEQVANAPKSFMSRADASAYLTEQAKLPLTIAHWLTASMLPTEQVHPELCTSPQAGVATVSFALDMPTVMALFADFAQLDFEHFLRHLQTQHSSHLDSSRLHFLRAGKNHGWERTGDWLKLSSIAGTPSLGESSSSIQLLQLDNVGHWLHAEQPKQVAQLLHEHSHTT